MKSPFLLALCLFGLTQFASADCRTAMEISLIQSDPQDQARSLYDQVLQSKYDRDPGLILKGLWRTTVGGINLMIPSRLRQSITEEGFTLPKSRKNRKMIHTFGSVALGHVTFAGTTEKVPVLIRASFAGPPIPGLVGVVPGVAIMFFEKGKQPVSLFLMNGLDTQGRNTSVFLRNLSNILPEPINPVMKFIKILFERVVKKPLGLVQVPESGVLSEWNDLTSPYHLEIVARPSWEAISFVPDTTRNDFRADLANIPVGTPLWNLMFRQNSPELEKMGTVVLDEPFVASRFGDEQLFFRHNSQDLKPRK